METTSNRVTASTCLCLPWLPPAFLLCFTLGLLHSPFSESLRTILLRLCEKQNISKHVPQIEWIKHFQSFYIWKIFRLGFRANSKNKELTWLLCLFSLPESSSEWVRAVEVLASWESLLGNHKREVRLHLNPKEMYNLGLHTLCSLRIWMKLWARVSSPPRICVQSRNSAYENKVETGLEISSRTLYFNESGLRWSFQMLEMYCSVTLGQSPKFAP